MPSRHHDLVIIGTGSGNSIIGPEFDDLDIAIVEKGVFGGTCLNVGCIPTKMFVYPADLIQDSSDAGHLGLEFQRPSVDWPAIRDRVFNLIDPIAAGGERYRRESPNVTVYSHEAHFVGMKQLDVGDGLIVTADRFVIAAGGRPRGLDIPGLEGKDPSRGVHNNETIMRVDTPPKRLVVVGGGFIAAEFAHVFDAVGSQVTWVHRGEQILRAEDESVSSAFTQLSAKRFDLRLSTVITAAEYSGSYWTLTLKGPDGESRIEADAVLLAIGRVPNTDLLNPEATGVQLHPDGRIVVDEYQRTNVEGIWALGDISSDYQLKHVANHEMRVVKHNLAHPSDLIASDHRFVPHAVFSHPQIAGFGKTEQELRAAGTPYLSKIQRYGDVAYGWAMQDQVGIVKVLADPVTRQLLGAHLLGYQASTVIQPLIQAAHFGQAADAVAKQQYWIHPALAEVVENALLGLEFED